VTTFPPVEGFPTLIDDPVWSNCVFWFTPDSRQCVIVCPLSVAANVLGQWQMGQGLDRQLPSVTIWRPTIIKKFG
jgi:hypothetical protein